MRERLILLLEHLEGSPDDAFLLYAIAQEYAKLGEVSQAIEYFNHLRSTHPDYIGLYYYLGKLEQQLGRSAEALRVFKEGLEIAKSSGDMHAWSELQRAVDEMGYD